MHCIANICYVCLEKKSKLISDINSSLSENKDIIDILGYLPFKLAWLNTMRIILICEECCLRLRETYQFLEKCGKNSAQLRGYMDKLNITPVSNTAELLVNLSITHEDINEVICDIQSEDEEINTFQWRPNIEETEDVFADFEDTLVKEGIICKKQVEDKQDNNSTEIIAETEDVFVNLEDYFVKEEDTWKQEETDDNEEYPMDNNSTAGTDIKLESDDKQDNNSTDVIEEPENAFVSVEDYFVKEENMWKREELDDTDEYPTDNNSTENMNNESDSEISVNDNAHTTDRDSASSEFARKSVQAANKNDSNAAAKKSFKCSTCSKDFFTKSALNVHTRVHTDEKSYDCAICKRRFSKKSNLMVHMKVHTSEKPHVCSKCKKCLTRRSHLVSHMRTHTGEKPYACSKCEKCFAYRSYLVSHMRTHTGEKPHVCSKCKKCFTHRSNLVRHMLVHTGEKPHVCSICKKCFTRRSQLVCHMRIHIRE